MSLIIVYFHGFGSSPTTDKVMTLRTKLDVPVYAFPADVDPDKAKGAIEHNIDMILLDNMHANDTVLFVGTSLGGWMASEMAAKYNVPAIVINPSCNPAATLGRYGVPDEIANKYTPIQFSNNNVYFFAENDEVINNTMTIHTLKADGYEVHVDSEADHRYNGMPFDRVIDYIKQKYF